MSRTLVVMPTHNQVRYLPKAYASVINQVDSLIVVDDASTDETAHWLVKNAKDSLRLWMNLGTAKAINVGIRQLLWREKGLENTWLSWVSSDNYMADDWVSTLLNSLEPRVGAIYGGYRYLNSKVYRYTSHDKDRLINRVECYYGPAFLIRADVWQEHRGGICHDYDNWLRVEEACWEKGLIIKGVDKCLCTYNDHEERATVKKKHLFDGNKWQEMAKNRRAFAS